RVEVASRARVACCRPRAAATRRGCAPPRKQARRAPGPRAAEVVAARAINDEDGRRRAGVRADGGRPRFPAVQAARSSRRAAEASGSVVDRESRDPLRATLEWLRGQGQALALPRRRLLNDSRLRNTSAEVRSCAEAAVLRCSSLGVAPAATRRGTTRTTVSGRRAR